MHILFNEALCKVQRTNTGHLWDRYRIFLEIPFLLLPSKNLLHPSPIPKIKTIYLHFSLETDKK